MAHRYAPVIEPVSLASNLCLYAGLARQRGTGTTWSDSVDRATRDFLDRYVPREMWDTVQALAEQIRKTGGPPPEPTILDKMKAALEVKGRKRGRMATVARKANRGHKRRYFR